MKTTSTLLLVLLPFIAFAQSNYNKIKIADDIELIKLSNKAYVHISVTDIGSFKNVSSNGLILIDQKEAFLFDTPVTEIQTKTLVKFITDSLQAKVTTFIPNHWHEDCMGGLDYLHKKNVKSYAKIVIPGHGEIGGKELISHTLTLFTN